MTRARKLAVALILAMSLAVSPLPVAASTAGNADLTGMYVPIQPHWDNVDSINMALTASDGTATGAVSIRGKSGTTQITATITLSRVAANGSLTTVRTWSNQSTNGSTFTFSGTNAVTSGGTYRLSVSANVTRNGVAENVSSWVERVL